MASEGRHREGRDLSVLTAVSTASQEGSIRTTGSMLQPSHGIVPLLLTTSLKIWVPWHPVSKTMSDQVEAALMLKNCLRVVCDNPSAGHPVNHRVEHS